MFALPVRPIHGFTRPGHVIAMKSHRMPAVVGVCLFILLIFSTATVFVQNLWAVEAFQIGVYSLVAVCMLIGIRKNQQILAKGKAPWLVYLIPLWGIVQILAHTTASTFETRSAVLRWTALAGVFYLTQVAAGSPRQRRLFLDAFLCFATALAVLCLTQLFTSDGKVLWLFPTGYPDVYATFPSYNNYAQFVELALPIALWRALREGWRCWWYALAGGLLYASAIDSASRAGAVLCTAELIAMVLIAIIRLRDPESGIVSRSTKSMLLAIPVLAALFTLAVGWQRVWHKFEINAPYLVRREYLVAAVDMASRRPLTGFGLGTFPEVYQQYAIRDFPFYANHAHNDWAEFAADGGIPFLLLVFIPLACAVPAAIRYPWGMGLAAVMLHACVDYPFPRPAVSGWIFVLLGLLYSARTSSSRDGSALAPLKNNNSPPHKAP